MKSLRMVPAGVRKLTGGRWLWTNFIKMCRDSPEPPPESNIPLWCSETIRGQIRDPGAQHSQARALPARIRGEYPGYVVIVLAKLTKCIPVVSLQLAQLRIHGITFAIAVRYYNLLSTLPSSRENCLYGGREQEAIPWRIKSRVSE